MVEPTGWSQYEKLVLSELSDLKSEQRATRNELSKVKAELSALQVKAGVWGGIAGLIPFGLFIATRMAG